MLPASAGAATWGTPTTVASSAGVGFHLAMGADGTAALTWASGGAVRAAVKRPGRPWGSPVRVSDGRFMVGGSAVAVSGRGEVIVAWVQSGTANGRPASITGPLTIRARARGTSGRWGPIRQIGTTSRFIEAGIDLAANAQGQTIAVWSRGPQAGPREDHPGHTVGLPPALTGVRRRADHPRPRERTYERDRPGRRARQPRNGLRRLHRGGGPGGAAGHPRARCIGLVECPAESRRGSVEQPGHRRDRRPHGHRRVARIRT